MNDLLTSPCSAAKNYAYPGKDDANVIYHYISSFLHQICVNFNLLDH